MAHLDYALLAEHARVDPGGALSLLGGSFSRLFVPSVPAHVPLAVAGRVIVENEEDPIHIRVTFDGPADLGFKVSFESELAPPTDTVEGIPPSVTFAVAGTWPIPAEGLYVITVQLSDDDVIRMTFRVTQATVGDASAG